MTKSNNEVYLYNNIDGKDYIVGSLYVDLDSDKPFCRFKYYSSWINNKYAYQLGYKLQLRKEPYTLPIQTYFFNYFRYCYLNEIDYFYEFLIIYLMKKNLIKLGENDKNRLYKWFNNETSMGPKFSNRYNRYKYIPINLNILIQNDYTRSGSIRVKSDKKGKFSNMINRNLIPNVSELDSVINIFEKVKSNTESKHDFEILLACASSLNGFQPKINIFDNDGNLCIAKLSSKFKNDFYESQREFLALNLASKSCINLQNYSINVTPNGVKYLLLKRFDRINDKRLPFMYFTDFLNFTFSSDVCKDDNAISNIIKDVCKKNQEVNLKEMFKRKIFRLSIGNTMDLLPNTAFLFDTELGWNLSPEFDISCGIHRNYDESDFKNNHSNKVKIRRNLIQDTINNRELYGVTKEEAIDIIDNFKFAFDNWQQEAINAGISEKDIYKLKVYPEALNDLQVK